MTCWVTRKVWEIVERAMGELDEWDKSILAFALERYIPHERLRTLSQYHLSVHLIILLAKMRLERLGEIKDLGTVEAQPLEAYIFDKDTKRRLKRAGIDLNLLRDLIADLRERGEWDRWEEERPTRTKKLEQESHTNASTPSEKEIPEPLEKDLNLVNERPLTEDERRYWAEHPHEAYQFIQEKKLVKGILRREEKKQAREEEELVCEEMAAEELKMELEKEADEEDEDDNKS